MNDTALRAALLGAWELVAWQIDYSDGRDCSWPFGPAARGLLLYTPEAVSYTHLRAHETVLDLVCRLLLEKKKQTTHV